jgi:hypothetical protein
MRRVQTLDIPDDEQGVLASLARLSDPTLEGLEHAINQIIPTLDRSTLLAQLSAEPDLASVPDLRAIISSLVNVASTSYSAGIGLDTLLDSVIATLKSDEVVTLSDEDAANLRKRLAVLTKSKAIEVIAKAGELGKENDRSFILARIVSDLRPICVGEELEVAGAVIVHQLSIRAARNGENELTFFALDSQDLIALHDVVARAVKKDRVLRQFASGATTPVLTPTPE